MARKRRPHWLDELTSDVAEDIKEMSGAISEAYADITPYGWEPTPPLKTRVKSYLEMQPDERQALLTSLGPEGYKNFIDKAMNDLVKVFGAEAAQRALPWFMGVGPEAGLSPEESEMAVLSALGRGEGFSAQ